MSDGVREVPLPYLSKPAAIATLASGHTIVVIPKPGEVVHLHTVVRTGSIHEDDTITGISHFLEHLMFKGTPSHPAGEFDRVLEGMGARINASTAKDWTQFYVTIPRGRDGEFYRRALEMHADMLLNPLLPDEEIGPTFDPVNPQVEQKRERYVVVEEIKMVNDNPWRRCLQSLDEQMYRHHPYKRDVIGTQAVIAGVSRETLINYYKHWYTADNMVTIVAGEFEPESAIADIEAQFRFGAERVGKRPEFPPEPEQEGPRELALTGDVQTGYVAMGFRGPTAGSLAETIALDMAVMTLGDGKSSRMNQRLVEQLPDTPFFDVGAAQVEYRDGSSLLAYGVCRPDALAPATEHVKQQIDLLTTEPLTEAEFAKARTRLEARFASEAEWAMGLCLRVADSMVRRGDLSAYTDYLPALRQLTVDDVSAAVRRYLHPDRLSLVTMAPEGEK